jgi:hypothetical protein
MAGGKLKVNENLYIQRIFQCCVLILFFPPFLYRRIFSFHFSFTKKNFLFSEGISFFVPSLFSFNIQVDCYRHLGTYLRKYTNAQSSILFLIYFIKNSSQEEILARSIDD